MRKQSGFLSLLLISKYTHGIRTFFASGRKFGISFNELFDSNYSLVVFIVIFAFDIRRTENLGHPVILRGTSKQVFRRSSAFSAPS